MAKKGSNKKKSSSVGVNKERMLNQHKISEEDGTFESINHRTQPEIGTEMSEELVNQDQSTAEDTIANNNTKLADSTSNDSMSMNQEFDSVIKGCKEESVMRSDDEASNGEVNTQDNEVASSSSLMNLQEKNSQMEQQSKEETSPPSPQPEVKATKKRLTLQERLALAAKGKSKKSEPNSTISTPMNDLSPVTTRSEKDTAIATTIDTEPVSQKAAEIEPTGNDNKTPEYELKQLKQELKAANSKVQDLNSQIKLLKSQSNRNIALSSFEKEKTELIQKLAAKDESIEQLLKEGEALSKKELKLNESIKKLKSLNNDLESSLHDYSVKNDDISMKMSELDDYLKTHNLKSIEHLMETHSETSKKLSETSEALNKEKSLNWENKYKELIQLFNKESSEKDKFSKELGELKIQFDMLKKQHELEIKGKDNIISDFKKKTNSIKEENAKEISRLESKIEHLRTVNENSSGTSINDLAEGDGRTSKSIDYDDFMKLSDAHGKLQQQHLSSQEVWKLLESNLLNKVDSLSATVESFKKGKLKLTNDLWKAQNKTQLQSEELAALNKKLEDLQNESKDVKMQLQAKEDELAQEQEKFEKFKQIYNSDRQSLVLKVKNLNETVEKYKNSANAFNRSSETEIPTLESRNSFRRSPSASVIEIPVNYSWQDIRLGESSYTPASNKEMNSYIASNHQTSSCSLIELDDEDGLDDAISYNSKTQTTGNNNTGSISGALPSTATHTNIQFINKMGSNIRRLEIELNTLKEENNQLALEKDHAQKELLQKIKLSDEIDDLNEEITSLRQEVQAKSAKEQTMLELIGEKSEQVEELKADVQDLKDLCKLQVQQMIELQESKLGN